VNSEYVTIEGDLSKLGQLKRLERVHLCKENMTDKDLKFIAALPRIKHLDFNADTSGWEKKGPRCTDRCADYISQATTLEVLWAHDAANFTDKFVSKVTAELANLKSFEMYSPQLTDESLRLLAERCKELNFLRIDSDRFTDEGVRHLGKAKNLKKLWLRSSSLNGKSVSHIKGLSQLQHLELTVPSVDDDDVRVLASFRDLEILALRRPALTDQQFAAFRCHPRLKSAFINGSRLSNDEVVKVVETLPNLKYITIGGNESLQRAVDQALARRRASR
jgi:Leucine-rich repeat (LRR) protein